MPRSERRRGLALAAVALSIAAIACAHAARFRHYVNDDAYITFRYSRALLLGRGPYYNPGEHVEGYTNPLQMLLMVPVIALAGPDLAPGVAKGLGLLWAAGAVLGAFAVARRLVAGGSGSAASAAVAGVAAAGIVAASPGFAVNAPSGLETSLYAFTLILGVALGLAGADRGRWRGAGVAFAAAVLTRPEGGAVFGAYVAGAALAATAHRRPRELLRRPLAEPPLRLLALDLAVVAAAVGALLAARLALYDGEWLPNTYWAKAGGFWGLGASDYVRAGALVPIGGLVGAAAALLGLAAGGPGRRRVAPVLAVAAGALLPFAVGTDWMPGWRLVVPYLPALAAATAWGWCRLAGRLPRRLAPLALALVAAAPVALAVAQSGVRATLRRYVEIRAHGYAEGHERLAAWLCGGRARPGDTIALMDIGIVGYRCMDQRILDVTGLTDRHIAKSPGGFLDKRYDPGYVLDRAPRFVVLTLTAPVEPVVPPRDGQTFRPGTPIESEIAARPRFRRSYLHAHPASPDADWLARLAASIGAERVFWHDYPGRYYLLAVFERAPASGP